MEREELKTKVVSELGGTQLTLSERTINEELDDALTDITDDAQVTDTFVQRLAKRLKRMDGNLHADVGAENRKYKEQFEKDWKEKHPEGGSGNGGNGGNGGEQSELEKKLDKLMKDFEEEKNARMAREVKEKKETTLSSIKDGVKKLFEKAGVEPNEYILKQTMRDVEIGDNPDVDAIVKATEKAYYKNLKEAGLEETKPHFGGGGGSGSHGNSAIDDFFKKKAEREGWSKK